MSELVSLPEMRGILARKRDNLSHVLPSYIDVDRFINVALMMLSRRPDLAKASQASLILSISEAGRLGLHPDGREATIIVYKGQAVLIPMVQGIINLMLRSPGVLKIEARAVFEGDEFYYEYGIAPKLVHRPDQSGHRENREVTHAYAIIWRQGTEPTFEVVHKDEIEQARLTSRAPDSPAWKAWYSEMARKVAVKRLAKYLDLSPEANRVIAADHQIMGDEDWADVPNGLSDEYANLLLKSRTEEGIEDLRRRLAGEDQEQEAEPEAEPEAETDAAIDVPQTEPQAEHEPEPEPEPQPAPESTHKKPPRLMNQWEGDVVQALMDTGLAEARTHAVNLLNLSCFIELPYGHLNPETAVAWALARKYAKEKDSKGDSISWSKTADTIYPTYEQEAIDLLSDLW